MSLRTITSCNRNRGSVYVLVLSVSMVVTIVGLSAMNISRIRVASAVGDVDAAKAKLHVQSYVELIVHRLGKDVAWRNGHDSGQYSASETVGNVAIQYMLVDEMDNDLANDPMHDVRLYVRAKVNQHTRIYSVLLIATTPPNLLRNPGLENGLHGWSGVGPLGSCSLVWQSGTPHRGLGCVLASSRSNTFAGPHQNMTGEIVNGQSYYTEVWIKGTLPYNKKWVVLDLDTSEGMKQAAFYDAWAGPGWRKVSGILTPTWTGTLHGVYWKVGTEDVTDDFYIDDALLVEGTGPPQVTMRPAAGTWRQEIEQQ